MRIAPKDDGGLLGAAELAWDAAKGVPLRAAVYAQGSDEPVLELEATDVKFGSIPTPPSPPSRRRARRCRDRPAGRRRARKADDRQRRRRRAAEARFELAAPEKLAGLPRTGVRLVRTGDRSGAISTYGEGIGAIVVFQHEAAHSQGDGNRDGLLPEINIDGATGTELATPLGTVVTFTRGGVSYVVAGSVPPVAAESAARELR